MSKATIFLLPFPDRTIKNDEIIEIFEDDVHREMYRVSYKPADLTKKRYEFYLTESHTRVYVADLLKSLSMDSDPAEYIQITTRTGPSVLYQVADLQSSSIRWQIENMIDAAIRTDVEVVRTK